MRILILTQWFTPEPDLKGLPFAKELSKLGHEVQVLTGFPNYPGGKIYDGYKIKFFQREFFDDIEVIRVPLYPNHDQSAIKRGLNYLSFAFSATIFGLFLIKKADVQYVYHPPATIAIPALAFKLIKRIPIVYDIQDLWPDTLRATGMIKNNLIIKIIDNYCKICYSYFDKIVVLSDGFKSILSKRNVPAENISVVLNWSLKLEKKISSVDLNKYKSLLNSKFNVLFAGTMGKAQSLEAVLDAARLVKTTPKIQFVFIGDGIEVNNLQSYAKKNALNNVKFLPKISEQAIGAILDMADILLVHLKNDPLFEITIPSKTQAYLKAGKPILMAVKGDACALIKNASAGICCEPENAEDIAKCITDFYCKTNNELQQIGKNGSKYYNNFLSIEAGTKKMISIFSQVIKNKVNGY